jgi:hypothetical protein
MRIEDVQLATGPIVRVRADGPAGVVAAYGDRIVGRASWHRLAGPRAAADITVEPDFARSAAAGPRFGPRTGRRRSLHSSTRRPVARPPARWSSRAAGSRASSALWLYVTLRVTT